MKRIQTIAFACIFFFTIAMLSCNDPLQIGADLDGSDVQFFSTDTITINALSISVDSTIAYQERQGAVFGNQQLGWNQDPIFGDHIVDLFVQLFQESVSVKPEGQVDSVVLAIQYNTADLYGNPDALFDFEVVGLDQRIDPDSTYYINDVFSTSNIWGNINGYDPIERDSIRIVEINNSGELDTIEVTTQLRLKLDNALGDLLMNIDSASYSIVDSFLSKFNGLLIKPTVAAGAILPLLTTTRDAQGINRSIAENKLSLYYRNLDNEPRQYDYIIGGATFSLHEHIYSSGSIDGSIDNQQESELLLYLQGGGGPSISVQFPNIASFGNVSVNEAILELTTVELAQDNREFYPLPPQLFTLFSQDSSIILTPEINTAVQGFRDIALYGGNPIEVTEGGETKLVYRFNISNHVQSMIEGTVGDKIFIRSSENSTGVERAIFKGVKDSDSPIKLKITYTEL